MSAQLLCCKSEGFFGGEARNLLNIDFTVLILPLQEMSDEYPAHRASTALWDCSVPAPLSFSISGNEKVTGSNLLLCPGNAGQ